MNRRAARFALIAISASFVAIQACTDADTTSNSVTEPLAPTADIPSAGRSAAIDAIRGRGVLRAATLAEFPFLIENTSGIGGRFSGPAWTLATEAARRLGVRLEALDVSHETKIAVLQSSQADVTIAPLWLTEQRATVIDFILYSSSSMCLFGLRSNPKLEGLSRIEQVNRPDYTLAYFAGGPGEALVTSLLPNVSYRAVPGSGGNAPVEEILSRRADVATVDRAAWPKLARTIPGLRSLPPGEECLRSRILSNPVGIAIRKGDPVYRAWLQAVADDLRTALQAEELAIIKHAQ